MKLRQAPARWADWLVGRIARHKAGMLALSIFVAIGLAAVVLVELGEGEGDGLTAVVTEIGGYVAIFGLVLGLPALGYAMVTDRAVGELREELGLTEVQFETVRDDIGAQIDLMLAAWGDRLPDGHQLQVFAPNLDRTRLVPLYDPDEIGPVEGWAVNDEAPQAVTGSAWVEDVYLFAMHGELKRPELRLTAEQHQHFDGLTGVAAAPIHDADKSRIGVLTIFTEVAEPCMNDPAFIERHRRLAGALSSIVARRVQKAGALRLPSIETRDAPRYESGSIAV